MGIQLSELVEGRAVSLEELFDKRIAVDAFNWIHQFLSIIRQHDGTPLMDSHGNVTSHLSGIFYRTLKLIEAGIKPMYVFDGEMPSFKRETAEQRKDVRQEAMQAWKDALERKDYAEARKQAQRSSTITSQIIKDSKELLEAMGVPVIQAPSEGEALASVMARKGDAYATATQDYDSLLFGCPRVIRNLSITGKRKRGNEYVEVTPDMILLQEVLEKLQLSRDQLIILGMLVGTDYNPGGVTGYGPKKSLELVREKKTLDAVLKEVSWNFDVSAEEIFEFFRNPHEIEYSIEFRGLDEEKIKRILCDEHDFSAERIDSALKKINPQEQRSLQKWFK